MQCPNCGEMVFKDTAKCPKCAYDLVLYGSLNEMKDRMAKLRYDAESLKSGIDNLGKHLEGVCIRYEQSVPKSRPSFTERDEGTPQSEQPLPIKDPEPSAAKQPEKRSFPAPPPPLPEFMTKKRYNQDDLHMSEVALGQKWLLIAGIATTVLAVGWFLKYSFDKNWISPAGRVALSYLCGMLFLGAGELCRRKNFERFGLYIIGGGIATLYFSTFAAFQIYHLISQAPAFGLMVLITAMAGILSLVYDTKWLSVLGIIGGFLTPIVLSTGQNNQIVLMTYMTILNAGIVYIAFYRQWQLLNYLGFVFTWMLFSGWFSRYYQFDVFWQTFVFLNGFFLTYACVPFAYHMVHEEKEELLGIGMIVMNGFIAFGYAYDMIRGSFGVEYVSLVTFSYAAIFLSMARLVYQRNREQVEAFIMLLAVSMVFLFITVPILFSKEWVTFFWLLQAVCLIWASLKLENEWLYRASALVLLCTVLKFFTYDYGNVFNLDPNGLYFRPSYTFHGVERFVTEAVLLLSAYASAQIIRQEKGSLRLLPDYENEITWFWAAFAVMLFAVLNVEMSAWFHDYAPQARFASLSVLWTLFSVVLIMIGFLKNIPLVRQCAMGLFAVTLIKVFFIDMENVTTPWRIVSFLVLGIMLIGASFLYYRFKDRIAPDKEGRAL